MVTLWNLFRNCPNLTNLTLKEIRLYRCDPINKCISNSLARLFMFGTTLSKDVLTELSSRIPSLKLLMLSHCQIRYFEDADGNYNDQNRYDLAVDMQHSSLDLLSVFDLKDNPKKIFCALSVKEADDDTLLQNYAWSSTLSR